MDPILLQAGQSRGWLGNIVMTNTGDLIFTKKILNKEYIVNFLGAPISYGGIYTSSPTSHPWLQSMVYVQKQLVEWQVNQCMLLFSKYIKSKQVFTHSELFINLNQDLELLINFLGQIAYWKGDFMALFPEKL